MIDTVFVWFVWFAPLALLALRVAPRVACVAAVSDSGTAVVSLEVQDFKYSPYSSL